MLSTEAGGYLGHFGFTRPPFSPVTDAPFLYGGPPYSAVRDELALALRHREGLILLVGESGTGKTTLCRSLLQTQGPAQFLSVISDPFLTVDDLLRQVLADFGVLSEEARHDARLGRTTCHDFFLMLQRFLQSLSAFDGRAVIVIDDAHQVEPAVLAQLRALSNLEATTGRLQIVLVGQPQLDALLRRPELQQLQQRVSRRCVLNPLTNAETRLYLEHRLAAARDTPAGENADTPVDPSADVAPPRAVALSRVLLTFRAVPALARLARGIPRTLNLLCDRALEIGHERQASRIDASIVLDAARRLDLRASVAVRLWCVRPVTLAISSALLAAALLVSWMAVGRAPLRSRFARNAQTQAPIVPAPPATPPAPSVQPAQTVTATSVTPAQADSETIAASALQTADSSYVVVVASFRTVQHANELIGRFSALGLPAFTADEDIWHVVLIGPYVTSDEASDVQERIGLVEFPDSYVRRQPVRTAAAPTP